MKFNKFNILLEAKPLEPKMTEKKKKNVMQANSGQIEGQHLSVDKIWLVMAFAHQH